MCGVKAQSQGDAGTTQRGPTKTEGTQSQGHAQAVGRSIHSNQHLAILSMNVLPVLHAAETFNTWHLLLAFSQTPRW